jgi:large subunit ribosomal protein L15
MRMHTLQPNPGAKHRKKRLGCGESSGHGKTSCKGNKGQNARSGGSIRPGFEGGQMPLHRRLPKKGFSNAAFARKVAAVNVGDLNDAFNAGDTVTTEALLEKGLVDGRFEVVKVLGNGKLEKALVIDVDEVSAGARVKIEQAGGSIAGITAA